MGETIEDRKHEESEETVSPCRTRFLEVCEVIPEQDGTAASDQASSTGQQRSKLSTKSIS